MSLQVINFELDKAFIPDVNKPFLDRAAEIITETPDMELVIIGHTDNLASDAYNLELSRERAESVKEYLVAQGVDADKLRTVGMGESEPIADNSTELGRFRNRRIEFTVYDENAMNSEGIAVTAGNDGDVGMGTTTGTMTNGTMTNGTNADMLDPDLNPLDNNNDDLLPDGDDPTQGTALDPTN